MPHYQLRISGHVQGVWYRSSMQQQAEKLGVNGIVRNEANGDVYAEIEGEESALRSLIAWAWIGPNRAEVSTVEVSEGEERGYVGFQVER